MTIPTNPSELFSPFLPTTYNIPEEEDRLKTFLVDRFCDMSDVINDKTIGAFTQDTQNFNGEKWIYDITTKVRNGYQVIIRIKSFVPATIPLPIKDMNQQFVVTLIYGSASKPPSTPTGTDGDYFSFMSMGDSRISFTMSSSSIIITTDGLRSAYSGFIVIKYLRDGA